MRRIPIGAFGKSGKSEFPLGALSVFSTEDLKLIA
jgi:hypothetical protein